MNHIKYSDFKKANLLSVAVPSGCCAVFMQSRAFAGFSSQQGDIAVQTV